MKNKIKSKTGRWFYEKKVNLGIVGMSYYVSNGVPNHPWIQYFFSILFGLGCPFWYINCEYTFLSLFRNKK